MPVFFAGIELGGTKAIALLADGNRIVDRKTIPTTDPDTTLGALRAQLDEWQERAPIAALGIASFGPIQLSATRPDFGHILATPKPGWSDTDMVTPLAARFHVPVARSDRRSGWRYA